MVAILIGTIALLVIVSLALGGAGRKRSTGASFYIRGRAAGFTSPEIAQLKKAATDVRLEEPASVYWSVKTLDECIKRIVAQNRIKGLDKDEKALAFQSKLFDYRKKIEFDQPKYKSGIRSSRQIDEEQRIKLLVQGLGVFQATVTDNADRYLTVTCPSVFRLPEDFVWKGKKVSVYLWRREDAGYVFDTYVLDDFLSGNVPLLRLAHTDSLFRAQKRQSVRARTKLSGTLYLLKRIEGAYEKPERMPGMRCIVEDFSEDGAAVIIGGKAKPGLQVKVQFRLGDQLVVMSGVVKGVDYDPGRHQSRLHFQAMTPSRRTKNVLLGYVYNIMNDGKDSEQKNAPFLK
jgi:c-di-GMP-binding flagellar brake protein YcgR